MSAKQHKWECIIDDNDLKKRIESKVNEIKDAVLNHDSKEQIGLLSGNSGLALFLFYLDLFNKESKYGEVAETLLYDAMERINEGYDYFPLSSGITGILWTLVHLNREAFIEADCDFEEILPILEKQMLLHAEQGDFDYLHGAMGFYAYLLYNDPQERSEAELHKLLELLDRKGIHEKGYIKWSNKINADDAALPAYGISLSHGISSTIILLVRKMKKNSADQLAYSLLKKSVSYLLSQKNDTAKKLLSVYPVFGEPTEEYLLESRLSWCYGDLGIAVALYEAGEVLNDLQLQNEAIQVVQHASYRRDLGRNRIADAAFCHGAVGVAHIFNRFYQKTRLTVFKDAAVYWYEQTLTMAHFKDGLAGYKSKSEENWVISTGLLEGVAGIGLSLISAISEVEPKWDHALLLS